ncbi:MAG: S9 family peptidase [bacterium]
MAGFERVGGAALSPDGRLIAYTVSVPIRYGEKSRYLTHVWLTSYDGRMNYQFTRGEESCTRPAFSPDGKYLAFLTDRGAAAKTQIWISRLTGGEAEKLTQAQFGVLDYAWSPDATRIAYLASESGAQERGGGKIAATRGEVFHAQLYTIQVEEDPEGGRKIRRLTAGDFYAGAFAWSPDSQTIAFEHDQDGSLPDIFTVSPSGGDAQPLVVREGSDLSPIYSPDGKWLAFTSSADDSSNSGARSVYVVPAKGGVARSLAPTFDGRPQLLGWSGNSKAIYFAEVDRTSRRLFAAPLNGKPVQVVTSGPGDFRNFSLNKDGRILAFVHESPEEAPNVFISSTRKFLPLKVTRENQRFAEFRMGQTRVIRWKSKDGTEIEGLLTYPVDHEIDKVYPLILMIHGGPAGVFTQTFTGQGSIFPIQAFAQAGYAVLRPNQRGSVGYGEDFRAASEAGWGSVDFDDLMTGVNRCIGLDVAHADSLCVLGWSNNGYLTAFIAAKSKRIKAASVFVVEESAGLRGGAGVVPEYFVSETEHGVAFSVAEFSAKGVKTPTQIIYAAGQASSREMEFVKALKNQGTKTEKVLYSVLNGERLSPEAIVYIVNRILAWFDQQLGRVSSKKPVVVK